MVLVGKIRQENHHVEIRKSQLRDKLGCWEVIRGFNPLPMASDFLPCEKKHRNRTAQSFLSTLARIAPLKRHTLTSWNFEKYTQVNGTSILPPCPENIYGSVGLENIFMVNILWQGLVLYRAIQ